MSAKSKKKINGWIMGIFSGKKTREFLIHNGWVNKQQKQIVKSGEACGLKVKVTEFGDHAKVKIKGYPKQLAEFIRLWLD